MNLLTKRDGELKETKEQLSETIHVLTTTNDELQVTKNTLEEEVVVRESYQTTEATLDEVARGLKHTTQESLGDLNAMFAKLCTNVPTSSLCGLSWYCVARKTSALRANVESVLNFGKVLTSETQSFSAELDVFIKNSTQGLVKLRSDEEQYRNKELENLADLTGRVNDQIQRVQDVMALIQEKDELSAEALESAQMAVKEAHSSIRSVFSSWSDKFEKSSFSFRVDLEKCSTNGFQAVCVTSGVSVTRIIIWLQVEKALGSLAALIQSVIHDSQEYMSSERKHSTEIRSLAEGQAEEQIRHLKEQNAQLTRLLQHERLKSERMKSDFVERVSGLFNELISEKDKSLEEAFTKIKQENGQVENSLNGFIGQYSQRADGMVTRNQELSTSLEKKGEQCKRLRDGASKVISWNITF
jgi:kinesin family protein 11